MLWETRIAMGIIALFIWFMQWMMPKWVNPLTPFGVQIPPERLDDPALGTAKQRYRTWMGLSFVVSLVVWVIAWFAAPTTANVLCQLLPLVTLILGGAAYLSARQAVLVKKQDELWMQGHPQVLMVETDSSVQRPHLSFWWSIPMILVVLLTVVIGAVRYPLLPDPIPSHYDLQGHVTGYLPKSIPSVFGLVFMQIALTAIMLLMHIGLQRTTGPLSPGNPYQSAALRRGRTETILKVVWILFTGISVSMLGANLMIWQMVYIPPLGMVIMFFVPVFISLLLLVPLFRLSSAVNPVNGRSTEPSAVTRDDDRYWKLGLFYVNRDDVRLLVEKRFGMGWTINFGRPLAWVFIVVLLLLIVAFPMLGIKA